MMLFGSVAPLQPSFPVCLWKKHRILRFSLQVDSHLATAFQKLCISSLEMTILVPVLCHCTSRHCLMAVKVLKLCDPLSEYISCICCLSLFTPIHTSPIFITSGPEAVQSSVSTASSFSYLIQFWLLTDTNI